MGEVYTVSPRTAPHHPRMTHTKPCVSVEKDFIDFGSALSHSHSLTHTLFLRQIHIASTWHQTQCVAVNAKHMEILFTHYTFYRNLKSMFRNVLSPQNKQPNERMCENERTNEHKKNIDWENNNQNVTKFGVKTQKGIMQIEPILSDTFVWRLLLAALHRLSTSRT